MPIEICHTLNSSQKEQIHSLEERCRRESPLNLTFPTESFDHCLLYYGKTGALLAAAAFTTAAPGICECSAFTDPAYRNQGIFSELLEEGLELIPEESDILFYSDGNCEATEKTLNALETEFLTCDYMMELSPDFLERICAESSLESRAAPCSSNFSAKETTSAGLPALLSPAAVSRDEDGCLKFLFQTNTGEALVSCAQNYYYFFSFEIHEKIRGLGHGEALLKRILTYLYLKKPMPVRLQVSGDNIPAISLYKKTGFRITDTLSTYLY